MPYNSNNSDHVSFVQHFDNIMIPFFIVISPFFSVQAIPDRSFVVSTDLNHFFAVLQRFYSDHIAFRYRRRKDLQRI